MTKSASMKPEQRLCYLVTASLTQTLQSSGYTYESFLCWPCHRHLQNLNQNVQQTQLAAHLTSTDSVHAYQTKNIKCQASIRYQDQAISLTQNPPSHNHQVGKQRGQETVDNKICRTTGQTILANMHHLLEQTGNEQNHHLQSFCLLGTISRD